ncbi:hypothetical protein K7711_19390 [Nocardia sp. CA2R105]|uniref:hypothetical protein n=1 Tax=Nocardia coffeae TaxID=2873381 RepID=UPI001CA690D7|nr:hypothetical protein [Nocardia coffeae]MBY8858652.1 hypothetical protein [Nocardia coffeae]
MTTTIQSASIADLHRVVELGSAVRERDHTAITRKSFCPSRKKTQAAVATRHCRRASADE